MNNLEEKEKIPILERFRDKETREALNKAVSILIPDSVRKVCQNCNCEVQTVKEHGPLHDALIGKDCWTCNFCLYCNEPKGVE